MLAIMLGLALAVAPQANANDAVAGRWKTETRNGVIEIQRCGASICGRLITSDGLRTNPDTRDVNNADAKLRTRQLRGLQILYGFKAVAKGWSGGKIYNAEDGKTYNAEITLAGPDQLKLKGCVFWPLCKTQTWTRIR
ncbi:DUF2147 domain-containing protein [Sphingomonas sp. MMS12-HWE2-04]|uniref:DUF2147 domain-containing protein n=1 Tax=Sphingomonas sp. MMS12-HWE2-04 TaxID=3234199 RepID=UPI0038514F10